MKTSFIDFLNQRYQGDTRLEPIDVGRALSSEYSQLDFVLPGLLTGSVGALVAPGGTGKSMFALQLSALITCGDNSLGIGPVTVGEVAYLSAEDPDCILQRRLSAIGDLLNFEQKEIMRRNLFFMPLKGALPNLMQRDWVKQMQSLANEHRLIIVDTLRRFHQEDENDGGKMTELVSCMESIVSGTDCSLLFIHHTNKQSGFVGGGDQQHASRGSSVLVDNIRWQAFLVEMSTAEAKRFSIPESHRYQYIRFGISKANYTARPVDQWLIRNNEGVLKAIDIYEAFSKGRARRAAL